MLARRGGGRGPTNYEGVIFIPQFHLGSCHMITFAGPFVLSFTCFNPIPSLAPSVTVVNVLNLILYRNRIREGVQVTNRPDTVPSPLSFRGKQPKHSAVICGPSLPSHNSASFGYMITWIIVDGLIHIHGKTRGIRWRLSISPQRL